MPIPVALAGLASIGATTGATTAATVGTSSALTAAGAGGLAAGAGGATAIGAQAVPQATNIMLSGNAVGSGALANGGMQSMPSVMQVSSGGYMPADTYQAVTAANQAAGQSAPTGLKGLLQDPRLKEYGEQALGRLSSGAQMSMGKPIQPPQLQRGPAVPFQPFQFDIRNYRFSRRGGY